MPTKPEGPERLVDTSVAIPLLVEDHDHHEATADALAHLRLGLCGHAAFETFSVLTRLPGPLRRTLAAASQLIVSNFAHTRHLGTDGAAALLLSLGSGAVGGGSVYDALVGAAAVEHGVTLATRDRRALPTYRALGVDIELLD